MVSLSYTPFWPDFWPKEASWESELTGYLPERSALTTGEIDSFSVCYPWATSKTYWCPRLYACRDKDTTFNSRCWMFRLCVTNYVCCTRRSTESAYMQALWRHAPSKRPLLASWWKFHTLKQTTNNTHTHLVLLYPSIAARTIKETKDRGQTRAIIPFFCRLSKRGSKKHVSVRSSEMYRLVWLLNGLYLSI